MSKFNSITGREARMKQLKEKPRHSSEWHMRRLREEQRENEEQLRRKRSEEFWEEMLRINYAPTLEEVRERNKRKKEYEIKLDNMEKWLKSIILSIVVGIII